MEELSQRAIHTLRNIQLPPNAVAVFDIDDTLIRSRDGTCIEPIVMVYNCAKMLGITPVIVTFRRDVPEVVEYTEQQLLSCGITGYNSLYLCPVHEGDPWKFKVGARKDVHTKGMTVVMSIGDQDWDVTGGYAGIGVKVPRR